jgi:adenosylcobinamide kinase/adenosylcobinamide-phosphate guanylyltransferase
MPGGGGACRRGVITLVLGGARSGTSELAEGLCRGVVTYVATSVVRDPDMAARIAVHRERRPLVWETVEAAPADLVDVVRSAGVPGATLLLDSLTAWVAESADFAVDGGGLRAALRERAGDAVVVSDEVGLGVHPSTEAGRLFRDRLGELNREVAAEADRVLLVVAGRALVLEPFDDTL